MKLIKVIVNIGSVLNILLKFFIMFVIDVFKSCMFVKIVFSKVVIVKLRIK